MEKQCMRNLLRGALGTALLSLHLTAPGTAMADTSVTTHGITFTFDRDRQVGRFVDGEPWVVGPVTVTSMTPGYSNGRNGYEVNPVTLRNDVRSLDNRLGGQINGHVFTDPPSLPHEFRPGESILKVRSVGDTSPSCVDGGKDVPRTCIANASVLTVLSAAPPANSFRPPFSGTEKPIFSASQVDIAGKLPNLPVVSSNQISVADALKSFGGVLIDYPSSYISDRYRSVEGVRNIGGTKPVPYGSDWANSVLSAALRTLQGTPDEKRQLVYEVMQRGIDVFYAARNGRSYEADGGINGGKKPLIMYTGYMLSPQRPEITNLMIRSDGNFQEDGFTYRGVNGEALWGREGPADAYNACAQQGVCSDKTIRDPAKKVDGGRCKSGPACSGSGPLPTLAAQRSQNQFAMGEYQDYTSQYFAGATLARVLGFEDEWNHQPFFEYVDRIATAPWNRYCVAHCEPYAIEMHRAFGKLTSRDLPPPPVVNNQPPPPATPPPAPPAAPNAPTLIGFEVVDFVPPSPSATGPAVTRLDLYNASSDTLVRGSMPNALRVSQAQQGTCLAVFVKTTTDTGGVRYDWTGPGSGGEPTTLFEQNPPFCFRNDVGWKDAAQGVPNCECTTQPAPLSLKGKHRLRVTPCSTGFNADGTCPGIVGPYVEQVFYIE